ncbi:MAG: arsenic transporter, partial [Firmicutes bacterium]|nr:arsenic transporter [Bacillota bacterium]
MMNSATLAALILFAVTYVLIFALEKARPYIALASAVIFVAAGMLGLFADFDYGILSALSEIDWNVLMMIAGTMGTVELFIDSKMPNRMSDIIISKVGSVRWMIVAMSLFAGIISAFVDNVATVLMIAPVALAICKKLDISPVPTIICISISSNLQGAATLVGDTTSILLAKAADLDFMDFFFYKGRAGMFWVTEAGALVSALIIMFMFRKDKDRIHDAGMTHVEDKVPSVLLALTILSLIAVSFIPYKDVAAEGQLFKPDWTIGALCMLFFIIGIARKCIQERSARPFRQALWKLDFYTLTLL